MKKVTNIKEMHENAIGGGHNSDELLKKYVVNIAQYEDQMMVIRGKIKAELQSAKDDGFLKMAIRKAVKSLTMTEEQRQAKQEVEIETRRITELCRDLPLFSKAA